MNMGKKKQGLPCDTFELDLLLEPTVESTNVNASHFLSTDNWHIQRKKRARKPFPFCIFFILGNEFCERYSYYGMRTILVLYLKYYLHWDSNTATAVYHAFTVMAYLFPLVGAMIADSWWGKYRTILWLSIVYAIGMVINTLGAIGDLGNLTVHAVLSSIGLFVIAFGTGGIKPCVSAFGGDQFDVDQDDYRRSFFSLFYFAINAGSLISTFVSPIIREDVQCFGGDCYALAFGIPAILMIVAIISFVIGTRWYRVNPPAGNMFVLVSKTIGLEAIVKLYKRSRSSFLSLSTTALRIRVVLCTCYVLYNSIIFGYLRRKQCDVWAKVAVKKRWNTPSSQRTKSHFMDYAEDGTNEMDILIRDIKYVLNVLVLFLPLPLFWSLFDQQGSRWTLQAVRMDGYVGALHVLPDQMQICNPLIIVTLIPLFEVTLYPLLRKMNVNFSPLRRMTAGMLLAGLSFVVAALVQMMIDVNLTKVPLNMQQTSLRIINSAGCKISYYSDMYPEWMAADEGSGTVIQPDLEIYNSTDTLEEFIRPSTYTLGYGCVGSTPNEVSVSLVGKQVYDFIISNGDHPGTLKHLLTTHETEKSDSGSAFTTVFNAVNTNINFSGEIIPPNKTAQEPLSQNRGTYEVNIDVVGGESYQMSYTVKTGGLYTLVVRDTSPDYTDTVTQLELVQYTDIYYNDVNIFWMIPQYFIITLGEVFLSVTGLEFAYSQAPPSMKSVLQSFWLLTVSIGNIIVLIIAEARLIPSQADEYFLFAGLIAVAAILFVILAVRYEYVDESLFDESESDGSDVEESSLNKEDLGKDNAAFDHNTEL